MSSITDVELDGPVFLKPEVKIEPLVCNWYAWPYLIAPAQHAMNVAFRHIPLLQSFISNPSVHLAATRDRNMFGGPFVNLTQTDLPRAKALLADTMSGCARLMGLARDLKGLDACVQAEASGFSVDGIYERLPPSLQGLVEIVYDTNNHPQIRLLEELLYDEDIAAHAQQICISTIAEGERAFFMSTPRLKSGREIILPMKFSDRRFDTMAVMRTQAGCLQELARSFNVAESDMSLFRSFFTPIPPPKSCHRYEGGGVRVRYFGHACVLIQTSQTSILLDPLVALEQHDDGRLTFFDLPDFIDFVVLTHSHQDHCVPEMLMQLRHRIGQVVVPRSNGGIADPSMKLILRQLGFANVRLLDHFEEVCIPDGRIMSLPFPGEHSDLDIGSKQAVFVEVKGRGIMFLVDSNSRDSILYQRIVRKLGRGVDALFLGMECHGAPLTWLYGPLLGKSVSRRDDESRRLSASDSKHAWAVMEQIRPARAFVYAMGQEPWLRYIMGLEYSADSIQLKEASAFVAQCSQAGLAAEMLHISRDIEI